jgi:hypothetical protein
MSTIRKIGDTTTRVIGSETHLLEAVEGNNACDGCCLFGRYDDGEPYCDNSGVDYEDCVGGNYILKDRGEV